MDNHLSGQANFALMQAQQVDTHSVGKQLKTMRDLERIEKTATDFEAVFISEMMKPMFEGLNTAAAPFGGGKGEEVFSGILLQEYGKMMAGTQSVGIADQVKAEMIRLQGLEHAVQELNDIQPGSGPEDNTDMNITTNGDNNNDTN